MLKQRVLTALILGPPVIAALWLLPTSIVSWIILAAFGIGAWEWGRLLQTKSWQAYLPLGLFVVCVALLLMNPQAQPWMLLIGLGFWIAAVFWLVCHRWCREQSHRATIVKSLACVITLAAAWLAFVALHQRGPWWLLGVLALVWAADIGAYFAGKALGKRKLAPVISPNKTWEGAVGGLLLAFTVAALLNVLGAFTLQWPLFFIIVAATVVASIVGDLFISMLKRHASVKDSSHLLPGHGGILDRVDSWLSASVVFTAILNWL